MLIEDLEGRVHFHLGHDHPESPPAGSVVAAAATAQLPDLVPLASESDRFLHGWTVDTTSTPGKVLLRLSTAVANVGAGALEIRGATSYPDGSRDVLQRIYDSSGSSSDRLAGRFIHHPEHGHIHYDGFTDYALRRVLPGGGVGEVVGEGHKTSFCLIDSVRSFASLPGSPVQAIYTQCESDVQGVSVGWADVYDLALPDQWVDATGVPAGQYWLEVIADPNNHLLEANEANNVARILIDFEPVGGQPIPDRFEPNESFSESADLGILGDRTENSLSIDPDSAQDYFTFVAASTGRAKIDIVSPPTNQDIDLYLFDDARMQIASSTSTGKNEHLEADLDAGKTYYVRVNGFVGATNPNYSLVIKGPPPTVTIAVAQSVTAEGSGTPGAFTITRNGPTTSNLTVSLVVAGTATNGVDYQSIPTSVVIPVLSRSVTIPVSAFFDSSAEPGEAVLLSISEATVDQYTVGIASATIEIAEAGSNPTGLAPIDVGAAPTAGSTATLAAGLVVASSGAGFGKSDAFHFAQVASPMDGLIAARFDGFVQSPDSSLAGIAVRDGVEPKGKLLGLFVRPSGELVLLSRKSQGGKPKITSVGTAAAGTWLGLISTGKSITAQHSSDGASWNAIRTIKLAIADRRIGIAVAADGQTVASATFGSPTVTIVPASPQNLSAFASSPASVDLAWQDASSDETGFLIERRVKSARRFVNITEVPAGTVQYVDASPGLRPKAKYVYRVRAINAGGASAAVEVGVTLSAQLPSSIEFDDPMALIQSTACGCQR